VREDGGTLSEEQLDYPTARSPWSSAVKRWRNAGARPTVLEPVWRWTFSPIKANRFLVDGERRPIVPTRPPWQQAQ
jgi:hypothetical protein